jgi:haloacetate dehalogenase
VLFVGFEAFDLDVGGAVVHGVRGGQGPPVLLLHGFPQTHAMWHEVAPALTLEHTVVATDLRGYGDSSRPPSAPDHAPYSFRAMAADQVACMAALGHRSFAVVGHDRGARVCHRMALDHPHAVERVVLMDILPTAYVYGHVDRRLAIAYYHWFFFVQPDGLPERLIAGDPAYYVRALLARWGGLERYHPEALGEFVRCFDDPDVRHAMMEDYRAGATIDLEHDAASASAGERVSAPTLVLWGAASVVGANPEDPLEVWRPLVDWPVEGRAIDGAGHYLVEDRPVETLAALRGFLAPGPAATRGI